jgi:hypothetical protein
LAIRAFWFQSVTDERGSVTAGAKRGTGFEIPEHYPAMLTGNPIASLSIPI